MNFRTIAAIYFVVLTIEIFAQATQNTALQFFSKPLLMPVLIVYFAVKAETTALNLKNLIVLALVFSWLGDVLLLLDKQFKSFFIFGLIAFLIAHIFYILYFWKIRFLNNPDKLPSPLIFIAIATYSLTLFAFLAPNVKNLLIPVGIYALIISTMLGVSLAAFDFGRQNFGKISVAGTLMFIVSDSILAINRFYSPFEYAPVFVMLTYAIAQFLITEGSLRNLLKINRKDAEPQSF